MRRPSHKQKDGQPARHGLHWETWELEHLAACFHEVGLPELARRFQRGKKAVWLKANELGLCKPSDRLISITKLKDISGHDKDSLLRILRWAGLRIRNKNVKPGASRSKVHRVIFLDEALEAIEQWHTTETLRGAAEARSVTGAWLRRRLIHAGVYVRENHFRYRTVDVDAAIEKWNQDYPNGYVQERERDDKGRILPKRRKHNEQASVEIQ